MAEVSALAAILPDVVPELPGCSVPMIEKTLSRVLREFCRRTQTWLLEITQNIVKDTVEYDLSVDIPETVQICSLVGVEVNGNALILGSGCTISGNVITLASNPSKSVSEAFVAAIAVEPVRSGITVEEAVLNLYAECIADGVKGTLMAMPSQTWSSPVNANYYIGDYRRGLANARIAMQRGNMNTQLYARPDIGFIV